MPKSIFSPSRTLSMHLYLVAMETGEFSVAFATAAVLVMVILLLNLGGYYLMKHLGRRIRGVNPVSQCESRGQVLRPRDSE